MVQGGLQLLQGAAVLITGWLTYVLPLPVVVGLWSLAGVFAMVLLSITWPAQHTFAEAVAEAKAANAGLGSDVLAMDETSTAPPRVIPAVVTAIARRQPPTPLPGTMEP